MVARTELLLLHRWRRRICQLEARFKLAARRANHWEGSVCQFHVCFLSVGCFLCILSAFGFAFRLLAFSFSECVVCLSGDQSCVVRLSSAASFPSGSLEFWELRYHPPLRRVSEARASPTKEKEVAKCWVLDIWEFGIRGASGRRVGRIDGTIPRYVGWCQWCLGDFHVCESHGQEGMQREQCFGL